MLEFKRHPDNPIMVANPEHAWEAAAAFNPSVVKHHGQFHALYRAESKPYLHRGVNMVVSSIGYANSKDGVHFGNHRPFIEPEQVWEMFGCEDPRVTQFGSDYYVFYTALSTYPFSAEGIKVGMVTTKDFKHIEEKHPITPFNAKAMALFPEKIGGKMAAILTVHTDLPPAKIAIAYFDKPSDIWHPGYWKRWYANLDEHVLPLLRSQDDHVEVGAPPVRTKYGWLLIHSYIRHYHFARKEFAVEAVLLDLQDPFKIIGRSKNLLSPEADYELSGNVSNIVFPSGALIDQKQLHLYYGAADTVSCLASMPVKLLLNQLAKPAKTSFSPSASIKKGFKRYDGNPIIAPRPEFDWELKGTLNPAVLHFHNGVHILYRAFSEDETSTLGYAYSKDGIHINQRPKSPVYVPREPFEIGKKPGFSGCEDPRMTRIGREVYMCYTAYDGNIPRVALTSISTHDFLHHNWNWETPRIISAHNVSDKNAGIFPDTIDDQYVILHRVNRSIYIDFVDAAEFKTGTEFLTTEYLLLAPRPAMWDNRKIGISAPPIKTSKGWVLLYHGVSDPGAVYKVGAVLLDLHDPRRVLGQTDIPLLAPEMDYETGGFVHNVVFPCGAVVMHGTVYLYYGGGDLVTGVATMRLSDILKILSKSSKS